MLELKDGNVNLLISEEQLGFLQGHLEGLSAEVGVVCVLLIDSAGKIITSSGRVEGLDLTIVAALASGDYATTRELAKRVGEREFSLVFQRENQLNAYLNAIGEDALVVVLFQREAALGQIRIRVKATQRKIGLVLASCERKVEGPEALEAFFGGNEQAEAEVFQTQKISEPQKGKEEVEFDESGPEEPLPSRVAKPVRPGDSVRGSPGLAVPASLARSFWRIKKLADDCLLMKVQERQAKRWKAVGQNIFKLSALRKAGNFEECAKLGVDVEKGLMDVLEAALGLEDPTSEVGAGVVEVSGGESVRPPVVEPLRAVPKKKQEDLVWERIEFFHSLVQETTMIYQERLPESQMLVMLDKVDKDSCHRYPSFFTDRSLGKVGKSVLGRLQFYGEEEAAEAIADAFLDLLVSRIGIIRKIFGAEVERRLLKTWSAIFQDNWDHITDLGLRNACRDLMDEAEKRWESATPKKEAMRA